MNGKRRCMADSDRTAFTDGLSHRNGQQATAKGADMIAALRVKQGTGDKDETLHAVPSAQSVTIAAMTSGSTRPSPLSQEHASAEGFSSQGDPSHGSNAQHTAAGGGDANHPMPSAQAVSEADVHITEQGLSSRIPAVRHAWYSRLNPEELELLHGVAVARPDAEGPPRHAADLSTFASLPTIPEWKRHRRQRRGIENVDVC